MGTDLSYINEDLSHVRTIEVLGGEPFINIEHLQIIEKISKLPTAKQCSLSYITNGSVKLRPTISNLFKNFKSVNAKKTIKKIEKACVEVGFFQIDDKRGQYIKSMCLCFH